MDVEPRPEPQGDASPELLGATSREPSPDAARDELVRQGRRRAAILGVLTGLVMTILALGCILLLYLAVGR